MKRKRRLRKSTVAKIGASVLALAFVFCIIGGISQASNVGNEPFLQDAIEYGVVCNELYQTSDMETNFATGFYQSNGQTNGNTVPDKANASGNIRMGEKKGKLQFRGEPEVVVEDSVKKEVTSMIAAVRDYSESVVDKCDIASVAPSDMNNYPIDASTYKDDVIYVDIEEMVKGIKTYALQNGALKIKLRENQTVVLNSKEKDGFTIPRYNVEVVDGKKNHEEIARSIIWNFPYINDLRIASDNMYATVIAPRAMVNIEVTAEGWLVCDEVVSNNGEWHMISSSIGKNEKKEDPTPTPTATPRSG